jgi:hypothetical protein
MILNMIFCSYWGITQWLQNHLLTCPFKKLTGIDCPGCGFQRSVIALMQGNLNESLHYYPATIPLILATIFTICESRFKFDKKGYVKNGLYVFTGFIIIGSYILKMSGHQIIPQF